MTPITCCKGLSNKNWRTSACQNNRKMLESCKNSPSTYQVYLVVQHQERREESKKKEEKQKPESWEKTHLKLETKINFIQS